MLDLHLIDYEKCHEYARSLCGQYGIPRCDADDVGSDAFVESVKRAWRTEADTNPVALANRLMYTSVLNVINRRNTHASRMLREADSLGGGAGTPESPSVAYGEPTDDEVVDDGEPVGLAARASRPDDDWENPFWLRLFNYERKRMRREKRKTPLAKPTLDVIKAGLKDSRISLIKEKLNFSGSKFCAILDFFKTRFDLCFQALLEFRA